MYCKVNRKFKLLTSIILITFVVILNVFVQPVAKAADNDIKQDKYLRKLISDISYYTSCEMASSMKLKTKTEKLKGYNALSISAVVGYCNDMYSFSKNDIQKISYDLFGIKPNISVIPESDSPKVKYIVKNNDDNYKEFQYSGGEFGMSSPKTKIVKISKVKKNIYDVKIINKIAIYSDDGSIITGVKKVGTTNIRIKKNSKSVYKYNIIKLKYKGKVL